MARSILKPGGLKAVLRLLVELFTEALTKLLTVSEKGSGRVYARMQLAGDFEQDDNDNITFVGRVTTPAAETVGGEASGGVDLRRRASADAAVVIEVQLEATVD